MARPGPTRGSSSMGSTRLVRLDTPGPTPPARSGAAMVYDAAGDRLVLFGGIGDDALDDAWELRFPAELTGQSGPGRAA